jgi:antitoxin VapB
MKTAAKTRHVRLFKNGRSQAIRIPREFELPGDEAVLHRDSAGRLVIETVKKPSLVEVLRSLQPLSEKDAMPEIADPPPKPFNL